ncbi:hypothetical protein FHX81_3755 [Saccharothrix saharensis]|uniref:Uncharacterized protein n=1 Tax=Saccharothrix saharensis TaxID=571190 RepID=A0A543JEZ2_9PSEU|nr:hypothetical protein FHX81_3755 [Saccharothrix saharensis]
MTTYDRRALVEAYLDAHPKSRRGYCASNAYNAALREHQVKVLGGLQELFGVVLDLARFPQDRLGLFVLHRRLAAVGVDDTAGPDTADYDVWEDYRPRRNRAHAEAGNVMVGAGFFESRAATRSRTRATSTQLAVSALRELLRHRVMNPSFHARSLR